MKFLSGMKEICDYTGRSESTVLMFIRDFDFPAKKIGGVWETYSDAIDDWRRQQIVAKTNSESRPSGGESVQSIQSTST